MPEKIISRIKYYKNLRISKEKTYQYIKEQHNVSKNLLKKYINKIYKSSKKNK